MTSTRVARLFGLGGAVLVFGLVGGAMLHKRYAPPVWSDQLRPHGERGPCTNCHQVLPAPGPGGQARTSARRQTVAVGASKMQTGQPLGQMPGPRAASVQSMGQLVPQKSWVAPTPGVNPVRALGPRPIIAGTPAPHDWRGPCVGCHQIIQPRAQGMTPIAGQQQAVAGLGANTAMGWKPTPRLPTITLQQQAQWAGAAKPDPIETEAMGMSVRPTTTGVPGMVVVEVEGMAQRSGLKLGDVIRAMDGQTTTSVLAFSQASRQANPVRGVVVDAMRNGKNEVVILR